MNTEQVSVYLSLGSNLGKRKENLDQAMGFLSQRLRVAEVSSVYDTEPQDNPDQPRFLNMVCHVYTLLQPQDLLALLKGIEAKLGRVSSKPNSPRTLDIDILFYGKLTLYSSNLVIPHPRLEQRAFVLVPLAEIAPDMVHPVNGKKVKDLLKELKQGVQGVFKFVEPCEEDETDVSADSGTAL